LADRLDDDGRLVEPGVALVMKAVREGVEQFKRPEERRAPRVNRQRFDEVTIRTVPRYKTSSLSGNEWRFSAECEIKYKGRMIWEGSHSSVPEMLDEASRVVYSQDFQMADVPDTMDLCDQEGCSEPWVNVYELKKEYCSHCGHGSDAKSELFPTPLVRKFCERHSQRGDCALEDSQSNYLVVTSSTNQNPGETPVATTRAEDERKSLFGGTIYID
jgi:hypothetical protein